MKKVILNLRQENGTFSMISQLKIKLPIIDVLKSSLCDCNEA